MIIFKDTSTNTTWAVNGSGVPPKGTTISDSNGKTWSVLNVEWSISRKDSVGTLVATVTVIDLANATRGTDV